MFMMKVEGTYINLDACPTFKVWQDGDDVYINTDSYNGVVVKNVKDWEVHAAIAYKIKEDARHFDLIKTINFLRRTSGD